MRFGIAELVLAASLQFCFILKLWRRLLCLRKERNSLTAKLSVMTEKSNTHAMVREFLERELTAANRTNGKTPYSSATLAN